MPLQIKLIALRDIGDQTYQNSATPDSLLRRQGKYCKWQLKGTKSGVFGSHVSPSLWFGNG
jgi:hypothetical protein